MYANIACKQTSKTDPVNRTIAMLFVAVALSVGAMNAQSGDRVTIPLTDPSRPVNLKVSLLNGSITVKAFDGKEVIVEAHVRGAEKETTKNGMRRIPMTTSGINAEEQDNNVRIGTDSYNHTVDLTISVPVRTSMKLNSVNDGNINVNGVEGDVEVDNVNGNVTVKDVSGSVVAHALNGNLKVSFIKMNSQKPMSFSSMNGEIDVTFPSDVKATLVIRDDQGEVYSDFDMLVQPGKANPEVEDGRGKGGKFRVKVDKTVRGTINGGGQEIQLKNFNGNIFIRKAGK
jgi:hypothetical protein